MSWLIIAIARAIRLGWLTSVLLLLFLLADWLILLLFYYWQ